MTDLTGLLCGRSLRPSPWTQFLLRPGESRAVLGSVIRDGNIRHHLKRRRIQVITGTFPTGKWLHQIGKQPSTACELCRKAYVAQYCPTPECIPTQSLAHIQSAKCLGMKDMVTKTHQMCWEDLQQDLMKNSNARMQLITVHKEMSLKSVLTHKDLRQMGRSARSNSYEVRGDMGAMG